MEVLKSLSEMGDNLDYDEEFRIWIESMLPTLKKNLSKVITVDHVDAFRYQGDLYGLFEKYGIGKPEHYVCMLVNGYRNPNDYAGDKMLFDVPNMSTVSALKGVYRTRRGYDF